MNHWLGVITNSDGRMWIDQGWAVGSAGVAWAIVRFYPNQLFVKCIPALVLCLIGGALAGVAAVAVKKSVPAFQTQADDSDKEDSNG
jgi:O-antigen ligase